MQIFVPIHGFCILFCTICIAHKMHSTRMECTRHSLSIRNIDRRLYAVKQCVINKTKSKTVSPIHKQLPITDKNQNDAAFSFFHRLFTCLAICVQFISFIYRGLLVYGLIHSLAGWLVGDLSSVNALTEKKTKLVFAVWLWI